MTLDDIRSSGGGERGKCRYCEKEATAHVEVRVRERKTKKQVTSRTVTACDDHTVLLFQDLEKQIEKKRNGAK